MCIRDSLSGAEPAGQAVALQAGDDGAQGDDHGNDACIRDRYMKFSIHGGPCRTQKGIRQPQADEGEINDRQKQMKHIDFPLVQYP